VYSPVCKEFFRDALMICLQSLVGRTLLIRDRGFVSELKLLGLFGVFYGGSEVDWWCNLNESWNNPFSGVCLGSAKKENVRCCYRFDGLVSSFGGVLMRITGDRSLDLVSMVIRDGFNLGVPPTNDTLYCFLCLVSLCPS